MAYKNNWKWKFVPLVWLIFGILMALFCGYCFAKGNNLWILMIACTIFCSYMVFKNLERASKRMRYIMEATLNGDFAYRFPTSDVNNEERETNDMLNRIVEHLEQITHEARQNEAFLSRVINLTEIGMILADIKGDIRLFNEASLRLLNRQAITHLNQISERDYADLDIKKSEVTVNEKSFTLITISDLSRQMQAVEVESWEKLTRVLTHEIMNSLTPIQSIAENMSGNSSYQEISEAFATISSSSRSLMQFVKSFREFSILPVPELKVIYLKPLLESCIMMAENYTIEKHICFNLICFPPELMVYIDESQLSRVLINILKNAIEANPKTISIEADEKADESVEIRISNDGEPIPEEIAEHIFTPFFSTRSSGSGIGLSLSRRLITHLGGTLTMKTQPLTCFSIRL